MVSKTEGSAKENCSILIKSWKGYPVNVAIGARPLNTNNTDKTVLLYPILNILLGLCLLSLLLSFLLSTGITYARVFMATTIEIQPDITIMEVEGSYDAETAEGDFRYEPRQAIAREFFRTHPDEYDILVIFSNFDFLMLEHEAAAFFTGIKNDISGIGMEIYDNSQLFGSDGRLQGIIDMGNIENIVSDPLSPGFELTMAVLSHEFLHLWAAHIGFQKEGGSIRTDLIGKADSHWSFLLDTSGSLLYGNRWQDNKDGTFTSLLGFKYYSPLDLYLMGLMDRSGVPSMLLIENQDIDPGRLPEPEVIIEGMPQYITIDDIIRVEGERIPGVDNSQKDFRFSCILITRPGTFTGDELFGIKTIMKHWVMWVSGLTGAKALVHFDANPFEDIPARPGTFPTTYEKIEESSIENGIAWLINNQQEDGSWKDAKHTNARDTAEAVLALKDFRIAEQCFSSGLQWISDASSLNTDYLSRKIEAFSLSGLLFTSLTEELCSRQNPDGGWGSNEHYVSNPTDTAFALKALTLSGCSEEDVIEHAIEYLKSKQNPDGGWGGNRQGSTILATRNVLSGFNKYRERYALDVPVQNGIAWLIGKQNADGGFGSSGSTVYDTAIALLLLKEFNTSSEIIGNALVYLRGFQSKDGSWHKSTYQTALAVRAMLKTSIDPDLSVHTSDIAFTPSSVTSLPTEVTVNVNIRNLGRTGVPETMVTLYDGTVSEANKSGEQIITLPGNSSATVTYAITITDGNAHRFFVVIDPEGFVKESTKSNNMAISVLYPEGTYDFHIGQVSVSMDTVDIFQNTTISAHVSNHGTTDAYNVPLRFYADINGETVDMSIINVNIPAGASINPEITWRANIAGNLKLFAQVDPANTFDEIAEGNNELSIPITVNKAMWPNLTISYQDIVFIPDPAFESGSLSIKALIRNEGFAEVDFADVKFYKGLPGTDSMLLVVKTISALNPGGSAQVGMDWTNITESGERIIHIRVDPDNQIREISEEDNSAFKIIRILSLPDLAISTNSIVFNPAAPRDGDQVSIQAMVQNYGEQEALNIRVAAYDGNLLIGSESIPSISGNSQGIATFSYDTNRKGGAHGIKIMVDPDSLILEQEERNNTASRTLGVQDADLWLTERYISPNGDGVKDSTMFFFRFEKPETLRITVINKKDEVVRTFRGSDLENISNGHIIWEGFNDNGIVVADGDYRINVRNGNDDVIAGLPVTVDNNRSPLTDAIGTESLLYTNLTCMLPDFDKWEGQWEWKWNWEWFPDERGIIFHIRDEDRKAPEYPAGVYTMTQDGEEILRLDWESEVPDEELYWSPDRSYIAYYWFSTDTRKSELWIIKQDGTGRLKIHTEDPNNKLVWYDESSFKWSPDSKKLAYITYRSNGKGNYYSKINNTDTSGNKITLPEIPGLFHSIHWLNKQKIIIVNFDTEIRNYSIWILDVFGTGNPTKVSGDFRPEMPIEFNPRTDLIEIAVNPDGNRFAFIEKVGANICLKVSDDSGNIEVLHESPSIGWKYDPMFYFSTINDLRWSRNGDKLAFMNHKLREGDPVNEGVCHYDGQLVVVDMITRTKRSFKATESMVNCAHSNPYVISSGDGDSDYSLYYIGSLSWLDDDITLMGLDAQGMFFINSENGDRKDLPVKITRYTDARVSPFGRYITYLESVDPESACYGRGTCDMWELSSLLNLTSDLNITTDRSAVVLHGTATDLNFAGYVMEYADTKTPGIWNLISPPSEVPVVDGFFAAWVPPHEGTFIVRLTVFDLAGNMAWNRKQVSWGLSSGITGLFKTGDIFSPNNDGIEDTVDLHYRIIEPVHLELYIHDENERLVKTFLMDHTDPGAYHITWDGTDENGTVVPDGPYSIKVLDYEFFFIVDNTPPETELYLSEIGFEGCKISARLLGRAEDDHLKGWVVEYGEGDNPQEWHEFKSGAGPLVNPEGDLSQIYNFMELVKFIVGKKFRITARDFAGNRGTSVTEYPEEILILHSWEIPDAPEDYKWLCIPLQRNSQGEIEAKEAIPPDYVMPGLHHMKGFESISLPIRSVNVQYLHDMQWIDAPEIMKPPSGVIILEWDNSGLAPEEFDAVRIKAVDVTDRIYYSNSIPINILLKIYPDCEPSGYYAVQMLTEDLRSLQFLIRSKGDETYPVWKVYKEYDIYLGDDIPAGKIYPFPLPPYLPEGVSYDLKMDAVTITGKVYQSLAVPYPPDCLSLKLEVKNDEAFDCESLSTGRAELSTVIGNFEKYDPDRDGIIFKTLSYYINEPDGPHLLREFDLASGDWKDAKAKAELDTSMMPEGNYQLEAILEYVADNSLKYIEADNALVVDRQLPQMTITFPAGGIPVCPIEKGDPEHGSWYGIPVEGLAQDNHQVKSYDLYYGAGQDPTAWHKAETRKGNNDSKDKISGEGPVQGTIGIWNVTDLQGTTYSLMLKVTDMAGNTGCAYTTFTIDRQTDLFIHADTELFSPNEDGDYDFWVINCALHEAAATIDAEVFREGIHIKTLCSGLEYPVGFPFNGFTGAITWDGKDDEGNTVTDGWYKIHISATDICGNSTLKRIDVEVDNTPPAVIITSPRENDLTGMIVEVRGTVYDLNLKDYVLEVIDRDGSPSLIGEGLSPIEDGVLGEWNTQGAEGQWTLRLSASDQAGNRKEVTIPVMTGESSGLIRDLDVSPKVFSPNNDGNLDIAEIRYELTGICDVAIKLFDQDGLLQKTIYTGLSMPSGMHSACWEGRDSGDMIVPEGIYTIWLTASLSSNAALNQLETITVIVDLTPPDVDMEQPSEDACLKDTLTVKGTVSDQNLKSYTISCSGDTGRETIDEGSQGRKNYLFSTIDYMPDGHYTLLIKAQDLGGNMSRESISFTIDRTMPMISLLSPENNEFYGSDRGVIIVKAHIGEENPETWTLRYGPGDNPNQWCVLMTDNSIPAGQQLYTSGQQIYTWEVGKDAGQPVPDGDYTLSLLVKDLAGWETEARAGIIIDNTPPVVELTAPGEGSYLKGVIDILGTASDRNLREYTVEISRGDCSNAFKWVPIKTSVVSVADGALAVWKALPADGGYCLRVTATDKVGNFVEEKANLVVDVHPPAAPLLSGEVINRRDARLTWTENTEPDFAGFNLYRNNQKLNTALLINTHYLDPNLIEGSYIYMVRAVDHAGWKSDSSNEIRLKIDTVGPEAKILSPKDGSVVRDLVDIKGTAFSENDFKHYRIYIGQGADPADWTLIQTSTMSVSYGTLAQCDTLGLSEGACSIKLEAEALTGAVNLHRVVVIVDNTPPEAPELLSATVFGPDVTLVWQANTNDLDLAGCLLYRNNKPANTEGIVTGSLKAYLITDSTYDDKGLPDGAFTYYIVAMDNAGNISTPSNSREAIIDTHAPQAYIVEPGDGDRFENRLMIRAESRDMDIAGVQFQYNVNGSIWTDLGVAVASQPFLACLDPDDLGLVYDDVCQLKAIATDQGGRKDSSPRAIQVIYDNIIPPDAPGGLWAFCHGNIVSLYWAANTEEDLAGYNVYKIFKGTRTYIDGVIDPNYQDIISEAGEYAYEVTALDAFGNESGPSDPAFVRIYAPIITQPYTPTAQSHIHVAGSQAADDALVEVFIDTNIETGSQINAYADANGDFFFDANLAPGENFITAIATDVAGNVSRPSSPVMVAYNEPPEAPTGLTASVDHFHVTLTWEPNKETDLYGYHIYRHGKKLNTPSQVTSGAASASFDTEISGNAFDSDPTTLWAAYNPGPFIPAWWEIGLASEVLINRVEIDWGDNFSELFTARDFEIRVWSGYAWITLEKVTGNNEKINTFEFKPSYRTNRIRVHITDISDPRYKKLVQIAEVRIQQENPITREYYTDANLPDGKYHYHVTAVDYYGFESLPSEEISVAVGDAEPPAAPGSLMAETSGTEIILEWPENQETDLAGYNVYRKKDQEWLKINPALVTKTTSSFGAYTDTNLANGRYTYRITAVDIKGNESPPSLQASATVTAGLPDVPEGPGGESLPGGEDPNLPDLETISDDIFIYPSMPVSGEDVSISVIVCNQGPAGAENVDADLFVWDSGGNMEPVLSETIPYIGPYSFDLLSFSWDTTARKGENNIIVILDASDTIKETFEENNIATTTFYVAGKEGVELATTLNYPDQYYIEEDIEIDIEIHNSGMGRDVMLDVQIEDEKGATVSAFDPVCIYLPYASVEGYHLTWNTGLIYAGAYSIRSTVRDGIEAVAEDTVSFSILPVIDVYTLVTTDKTRYGPNEDVLVTAKLRNSGQNYNIPELNVKIGITDSKNNNLFTEDHYVLNLLAGASGKLNTLWNTALYAPGEYAVFVDCLLDDLLISGSSSLFSIDSKIILTGNVIASPPIIHLGNLIHVVYTVSMSGNNSVKDLRVKVNVLDPGTLIIMSSDEKVIDLGLNETYTGEFVFSTEGYGLKNYRILLYTEHQGKWKDIASTSCTVKDGTPPLVQIVSPVSGSVIDGILDLSVIAKDNASGIKSVEYRVDDGIWQPLPTSDSSTGMYAISWTPAIEDEGPHTISFRATDRAGNISVPVYIDILIEFISLLEKLTGAITAQPNPVYTGQGETFVFSITNGSKKPVTDLLVTVLVMDPNTGDIKITLEKTIDVSFEDTVTDSFAMATDNLPSRAYEAILRVALAGEMDSKVLGSSIFEVKPSLEATKVITDPINLLVWVNDECHRFEELDLLSGQNNTPYSSGSLKECIRIDLLEDILAEGISSYTLVYHKQDFEKELRNPYYTDMLILGDHMPLEQKATYELRERLYSGTSIISSLWYKDFIMLSDDCQGKNSIFGIKFKGHLSPKYYAVRIVASSITEDGTFSVGGKAMKVEALEGTVIAGWIKQGNSKLDKRDKGYPAIVLNEYGLGKTIYLAFDIGLTLDEANYDQIAELIKNAILYMHRSEETLAFLPYHLAPLELRIKGLGNSLNVQATESFPREIKLYDPAAAEWITESPWIVTIHLNPDETLTVPFYVLTPDLPGNYILDTEVGFMSNGAYVFFRDLATEILIDNDTDTLIADIITRLNYLSLNQKDMKKIKLVVNFLDKIQERDILTKKEITRNIHDTLCAIDVLNMIDSVDAMEIRLMLDNLLRIEQGMYYFFDFSQ